LVNGDGRKSAVGESGQAITAVVNVAALTQNKCRVVDFSGGALYAILSNRWRRFTLARRSDDPSTLTNGGRIQIDRLRRAAPPGRTQRPGGNHKSRTVLVVRYWFLGMKPTPL